MLPPACCALNNSSVPWRGRVSSGSQRPSVTGHQNSLSPPGMSASSPAHPARLHPSCCTRPTGGGAGSFPSTVTCQRDEPTGRAQRPPLLSALPQAVLTTRVEPSTAPAPLLHVGPWKLSAQQRECSFAEREGEEPQKMPQGRHPHSGTVLPARAPPLSAWPPGSGFPKGLQG